MQQLHSGEEKAAPLQPEVREWAWPPFAPSAPCSFNPVPKPLLTCPLLGEGLLRLFKMEFWAFSSPLFCFIFLRNSYRIFSNIFLFRDVANTTATCLWEASSTGTGTLPVAVIAGISRGLAQHL